MVNRVLVDKSLQGTKIITTRGAEYGDNLHVVEVVPREFSSLCAFYPILITKNAGSGDYAFVSILGLEPGENLFLQGNSWDAGYIPLNIRRQPFLVVPQEIREEDGSMTTGSVLAIDMDSPRVNRETGEDIMDEDAQLTDWFRQVNDMISALVEGTAVTRGLIEKLDSLDLIEPLTYGFRLADGKVRRLEGLYTINEKNLRVLEENAVLDLHRLGFLDCIYSMRASLGHLGGLARRKDALLKAAG